MSKEFVMSKLKTYSGEIYDLCYLICEEFQEELLDEQVISVQTLCQSFGFVTSDKSEEVNSPILKEDVEILKNNYGKYVNELLAATLKKGYYCNWGIDEFYNALWKSICSGEIIKTLEEKAFALYYILIDKRIPYFCLDEGIQMDNNDFKSLIKKNEEAVKKIGFILNSSFNQKTEKASLVLQEIISGESYEDQLIRMVVVINAINEEKNRLRKVFERVLEES